jgi:hypothetical protein
MLQVQGSDWNSGAEPWLFYVNMRVRFIDLPAETTRADAKYHADGRIERIVADAPPRYDLTSDNFTETVALVASFAEMAGNRLPELLPVIRERALFTLPPSEYLDTLASQ